MSRIFTGAPLPEGANAVVIQEDTVVIDGLVQLNVLPIVGENVRPRGQDVIQGQTVLASGRRLLPQDLGLIASVGVSRVAVYEPLVVGLMSTGDELVEPPEPLSPGKIYNSNHYTLAGMIRRLGMTVFDLGLVADSAEATERALLRGAANADCIISSGGVSVGEEDHVKAAVAKLGRLDLWRIAIKPGKPMAFGHVAGVPFIGLPGNPVSSFVTFTVVAQPYLLKCQGGADPTLFSVYARAAFASPAGNRREYFRVQLSSSAPGEMSVTRFPQQGSGVMSSVSWANALAEQDIDQEIAEGDWLKVYPFT
ncbi:molybdopterin molybdotransferase MoeA [Pseudomonadales bacterium]|nr:molybdopterin molybdotransferase MoeA [Pseudomonadales bacterium]